EAQAVDQRVDGEGREIEEAGAEQQPGGGAAAIEAGEAGGAAGGEGAGGHPLLRHGRACPGHPRRGVSRKQPGRCERIHINDPSGCCLALPCPAAWRGTTWMAGTSPAMTVERVRKQGRPPDGPAHPRVSPQARCPALRRIASHCFCALAQAVLASWPPMSALLNSTFITSLSWKNSSIFEVGMVSATAIARAESGR